MNSSHNRSTDGIGETGVVTELHLMSHTVFLCMETSLNCASCLSNLLAIRFICRLRLTSSFVRLLLHFSLAETLTGFTGAAYTLYTLLIHLAHDYIGAGLPARITFYAITHVVWLGNKALFMTRNWIILYISWQRYIVIHRPFRTTGNTASHCTQLHHARVTSTTRTKAQPGAPTGTASRQSHKCVTLVTVGIFVLSCVVSLPRGLETIYVISDRNVVCAQRVFLPISQYKQFYFCVSIVIPLVAIILFSALLLSTLLKNVRSATRQFALNASASTSTNTINANTKTQARKNDTIQQETHNTESLTTTAAGGQANCISLLKVSKVKIAAPSASPETSVTCQTLNSKLKSFRRCEQSGNTSQNSKILSSGSDDSTKLAYRNSCKRKTRNEKIGITTPNRYKTPIDKMKENLLQSAKTVLILCVTFILLNMPILITGITHNTLGFNRKIAVCLSSLGSIINFATYFYSFRAFRETVQSQFRRLFAC